MTKFTTEIQTRGEDRMIGSSGHRAIGHVLAASVCQAFLMVRASLREIFDESAYERFLGRTQSKRSVVSYRHFLREKETSMARKPRCC